jgi:alcohol dehydrogenase (NADP+)
MAASHPSIPIAGAAAGGAALPAIGFGTWRCDIEKLDAAVYHGIRCGYRHIDCAGLYKNEHVVGAAIARAIADGLCTRADLFITSKLAPTQMEPALVLPTLTKTLADLQVDYLDLFITHWPYSVDPACTTAPAPWEARRGYSAAAYLAVWREMEKAVDAGLVRTLGCSNMTAKKLDNLISGEGGEGGEQQCARIPPRVVQVELHPFLAQPALKSYADAHGIILTGYCPLSSPGRPAQYRAPGDPDVLTDPVVVEIAARAGKTPAQVALRWAVQRGTVPLPRSTTLARIEENADVFSWALAPADMEALDGLDRTKGSVGRIMKGDNFQTEGLDWRGVWDEDWVEGGAA